MGAEETSSPGVPMTRQASATPKGLDLERLHETMLRASRHRESLKDEEEVSDDDSPRLETSTTSLVLKNASSRSLKTVPNMLDEGSGPTKDELTQTVNGLESQLEEQKALRKLDGSAKKDK